MNNLCQKLTELDTRQCCFGLNVSPYEQLFRAIYRLQAKAKNAQFSQLQWSDMLTTLHSIAVFAEVELIN